MPPSATVEGPLSVIAEVSLSIMFVVIVGLTTVAVALPSVTVKFSVASTTVSCVLAIVKLNSDAPDARSAPVLFVAVTVITPFAPVLVDNAIPVGRGQPSRQQRREVAALGRRARRAIKRKRHALAGTKPHTTGQAHRVGAGRGRLPQPSTDRSA